MAVYGVDVVRSVYVMYTVEASSYEEAEELVSQLIEDDGELVDIHLDGSDNVHVEVVDSNLLNGVDSVYEAEGEYITPQIRF